jgi:hypothetical protein
MSRIDPGHYLFTQTMVADFNSQVSFTKNGNKGHPNKGDVRAEIAFAYIL